MKPQAPLPMDPPKPQDLEFLTVFGVHKSEAMWPEVVGIVGLNEQLCLCPNQAPFLLSSSGWLVLLGRVDRRVHSGN